MQTQPQNPRTLGFFSIRWITYAIILISLLVVAAAALAFYWANVSNTAAQAARVEASQVAAAGELRIAALGLINNTDRLLLTRSPNTWNPVIQEDLQTLDDQINNIISQPLGVTSEVLVRNQAIVAKLQDIQAGLIDAAAQIGEAAVQGRWGAATSIRQGQIGELENQLNQLLDELASNTRQDTEAAARQVDQIQTAARSAWIGVTIMALVVSISVGVFTLRNLVAPLRNLNAQVQRIASGDLTPIEPLDQKDEVGQLSRSIALMSTWLRESYDALEGRVLERTQELEKRSRELQTAAQVAAQIASTDLSGAEQFGAFETEGLLAAGSGARPEDLLQSLLERSVSLIRERFNLYYAALFLVDERGEYAVLRAGTGQAGQEMLRAGHRLRVGQVGIVGQVTQSGQARVALDVTQDLAHFKNPLLPETRSEAALPVKIAGHVIGALDVQSREAAIFDQELIDTLQLIADQLAGAIQNARLLSSVQQNLEELQIAYGRSDRQSWRRFIQGRQNTGYRYQAGQVRPLGSAPTGAGLNAGATALSAASLRLPLVVRGQTIAELELWADPEAASEQTPGSEQAILPSQEMELLKSLAGRIAQSLEAARLYEEAQERLARQESINRLSASLGRSMEIEKILQNAAFELSRLPEVAEASVFLLGADRPTGEQATASPPVAGLPRNGGDPGSDHSASLETQA